MQSSPEVQSPGEPCFTIYIILTKAKLLETAHVFADEYKTAIFYEVEILMVIFGNVT